MSAGSVYERYYLLPEGWIENPREGLPPSAALLVVNYQEHSRNGSTSFRADFAELDSGRAIHCALQKYGIPFDIREHCSRDVDKFKRVLAMRIEQEAQKNALREKESRP